MKGGKGKGFGVQLHDDKFHMVEKTYCMFNVNTDSLALSFIQAETAEHCNDFNVKWL